MLTTSTTPDCRVDSGSDETLLANEYGETFLANE